MSNLARVEHKGRSYQGKWSKWDGEPAVPDPGQAVSTTVIGGSALPGQVVGYFTENGFLGCRVLLQRLPENLHSYPQLVPGADTIKSFVTFQEYAASDDAFVAHLFGSELKDTQPYQFPGHDALEEFAALVAAASYGRNTWRDKLDECWMNGSYWKHSYSWFSGELQRVRNGDGKAFVEYAVGRNQKWIEQVRRVLT